MTVRHQFLCAMCVQERIGYHLTWIGTSTGTTNARKSHKWCSWLWLEVVFNYMRSHRNNMVWGIPIYVVYFWRHWSCRSSSMCWCWTSRWLQSEEKAHAWFKRRNWRYYRWSNGHILYKAEKLESHSLRANEWKASAIHQTFTWQYNSQINNKQKKHVQTARA